MKKRVIATLLIVATVFLTAAIPVYAYNNECVYPFREVSNCLIKAYVRDSISGNGIAIPYTNKNLNIRGTATYGRSSTAYIDIRNDELYIYEIGTYNNKDYAYCSYPTGSGRVYAYIPLTYITSTPANGTVSKDISDNRFYVAAKRGAASSYSYYVDRGDTVYFLGVDGGSNEYRNDWQILYPCAGGWRIGWTSLDSLGRYL